MTQLKVNLREILTQRLKHLHKYGVVNLGFRYFLPNGKSFGCPTIQSWYEQTRTEDSVVKWPGVIENQWEINPAHKDYVEPYLHIFDITQLESLLPKHGFEIEKIGYFNYLDDTTGGDKVHIGFIATKR